jgi:hypothetical protein
VMHQQKGIVPKMRMLLYIFRALFE